MLGGGAWQWDESTGQYYLHSFAVEQPDLNWRNPEVEAAPFDTVRFWPDKGVDGFMPHQREGTFLSQSTLLMGRRKQLAWPSSLLGA